MPDHTERQVGAANGSMGAGSAVVYRAGLDATAATIERRARQYRNAVIAVVVVAVVCAAGALALRTPRPLEGALLLVPLAGVFFLADQRALEAWRRQLLAGWGRGELELAGLRAALRAHPRLPEGTLEGMLATLPSAGDIASERLIPHSTRRAVAAALAATHGRRRDALLLNVLASAVVVFAVLAALWLRAWTPILALVLLVLRPAAGVWLGRRRTQRAAAEVAACRREPGFSEADFERLVASVRERT